MHRDGWVLLPMSALVAGVLATADSCSCGFYDTNNTNLFTDSIIVYFNETAVVPSLDFIVQKYVDTYERGWNSLYTQGAIERNVQVSNATNDGSNGTIQALELYVDAGTTNHLVYGGGLKTQRQDVFFGSFRTNMRPAPKYAGGTALSMQAIFNQTESWELNNINPDSPSEAWVSTIKSGEFPTRDLGVNYTAFVNSSTIDPWDYTEMRVDWTRDYLKFYIGGELQRNIEATNVYVPTTPAPIFFKHWSVGNQYSTQGPPAARTVASIGYIRMFFNSSLTTEADKKVFSDRCSISDACSTENTDLRVSTTYAAAAVLPWTQASTEYGDRKISIAILCVFTLISASTLAFTFGKRVHWKTVRISDIIPNRLRKNKVKVDAEPQPDAQYAETVSSMTVVGTATGYNTRNNSMVHSEGAASPWGIGSPAHTRPSSVMNFAAIQENEALQIDALRDPFRDRTRSVSSSAGSSAVGNESRKDYQSPFHSTTVTRNASFATTNNDNHRNLEINLAPKTSNPFLTKEEKDATVIVYTTETGGPANIAVAGNVPHNAAAPAPPKKVFLDYLGGLTAMSCLIVTAIHFCLTFVNGTVNPGSFIHDRTEYWARKTVVAFFVNQNWIGPFLMTSTRFLVANYLVKGDLKKMAEKTVTRPFRMLVPVAAVACLEYFLMDNGALRWLEYLPSVTWSDWPYATVPSNFGTFISEVVELAYLIPNAAPQITFNYCTGVLWTIPVQLQGSWTTILGVIMIYEIKTGWKRMLFYAFCIIMHWYALSWGTYFYWAILLTDLELNYKWKPYLAKHAIVYWPVLLFFLSLFIVGIGLDVAPQWTGITYATYEYGIHPDLTTGLAINQTPRFAYPTYYIPKLNGFVFTAAFQLVVEISPGFQAFFSNRLLTLIHPHVFVIYLIHGFIFWSIGSTVCIMLATRHIPYQANIAIVAVICYGVLFLCLLILTPIVEGVGWNVSGNIWRHASVKRVAKRRPTLYPFDKTLLDRKMIGEGDNAGVIHKELNATEAAKEHELEKGDIQFIPQQHFPSEVIVPVPLPVAGHQKSEGGGGDGGGGMSSEGKQPEVHVSSL